MREKWKNLFFCRCTRILGRVKRKWENSAYTFASNYLIIYCIHEFTVIFEAARWPCGHPAAGPWLGLGADFWAVQTPFGPVRGQPLYGDSLGKGLGEGTASVRGQPMRQRDSLMAEP